MPNIKAAIKWVRVSEKRELRNRDVKTRLKTIFKKGKTSGDAAVLSHIESQLDKAASKGIIHPNKAARKKSRLAKSAQRALVAAAAPAPKPARKAARKKPAV